MNRPIDYTILLHDIYPDGLVALNKLALNNPLTKLWMWCNRKAFLNAKYLITLGRDMSSHCQTKYQYLHKLVGSLPIGARYLNVLSIFPLKNKTLANPP